MFRDAPRGPQPDRARSAPAPESLWTTWWRQGSVGTQLSPAQGTLRWRWSGPDRGCGETVESAHLARNVQEFVTKSTLARSRRAVRSRPSRRVYREGPRGD